MPETPYGFCECGCGEKTSLAPQTSKRFGWVQSEPLRFRRGHSNRGRSMLREPVRYVEEDRGHSTPCWIWQLRRNARGYGEDRNRLAHRRTYATRFGLIPEGLELDHLCRVPACVNPDHLEAVTHLENVRRGIRTKLTEADVLMLREWYPVAEMTYRELGEAFGVDESTIRNAITGKTWKLPT